MLSKARKAPFYSLKDRLDFLGRVYRVAKPVSEATGLSLPFILAHAAHEVAFREEHHGEQPLQPEGGQGLGRTDTHKGR